MTFLLPLIGLITGILAAAYLDGPLWSAIPILIALFTYLIILKNSPTPFKAAKLNSKHSIWILTLFSGIGILTTWFHRPDTIEEKSLTNYIAAYGEVTDIKTVATGEMLTINISQLYDSKGTSTDFHNLRLSVKTDGFSASIGDLLFFPCGLIPTKDNENYRSSGYADRLKREGINYSAFVQATDIKHKGHSGSFLSKASEWRDKIEIVIEKSSLNRDTGDFIISVLLGDRVFLDREVKATFSNAGVAHVLALSGMHIAIIMGIILLLLYPLKAAGLHKCRYWIAAALIWAYAFFTGLAAPTVRACIMTTFIILALSMQRKNASSNALLAAAFFILLWQPSAIYDIGLQLSFLCVACIITFAGPLNTINRHTHPRLHTINASVLASLVATLGTWVIVSYYFKRIPLLFLPVNLIMLPLLPCFISLALVYTVACMCNIDISILAEILNYGYQFFIKIANILSAFGNATIEYQATFPVILLWLLGVLTFGYAMKRRQKLIAGLAAVSMFAGSLAVIPFMSSSQPDGMIFQKKYADISMAFYEADIKNVMSFPRNTVSKFDFKGSEIFSVDCVNALDSLAILMTKNKSSKKKYLILGSGFKNQKLNDIPQLKNFEKIIMHPSIRKKKEKELLQEALDSGINHLYSLRENGALEINF